MTQPDAAGAGNQARAGSTDLLAALNAGNGSAADARRLLAEGKEALGQRFLADDPVEILVRERAAMVDVVMRWAWQNHMPDAAGQVSLIAVGGYGRGELHPASDVDVMVLLGDAGEITGRKKEAIESFLTFLWDTGLEIGHSVRSVQDCVDQAREDITIATALMEARLLAGDEALFGSMQAATGPDRIWPSAAFFRAKRHEQRQRHLRYHDTAYNLEPNVKGSPGGLRDIQMIGWVARRHFGAETLHQLISHEFLTEHEYQTLLKGRAFLWKIRFALHMLTGRREDRLLFDHQIRLAEMFGYKDATFTLAVEQLMQRYYRSVMKLSRLNEMLLQLFEEAILNDPDASVVDLAPGFVSRNGYLAVADDKLFMRDKGAILRLFRVMQCNLDLKGVSANTIRLLRAHRHLIDEEFRQNPEHHAQFLELFRASDGVTRALTRMNLYGVLGRYLPAFGRITGRMQYDLFHAYTVDAHTLFVVDNLRRFSLTRFNDEFPYCSQIMQSLAKPELAYLAGLFHDIAKGRGGDHSELGAVDAEAFCLEHGLSDYDARLVAWLVRHHLQLSVTAQKKDISDPQVIHDFAVMVGDQVHLDYLYVLTVADVRATNPKLWNSWKASLFEEFYRQVRDALVRGLENPLERAELIAQTRRDARGCLADDGIDDAQLEALWGRLNDDYFLRHRPDDIAWHTRLFAEHLAESPVPFVAVRNQTDRGAAAVFVFVPASANSFAGATATLDELGLNILSAEVCTTSDGFSLETYEVMEGAGGSIDDVGRRAEITRALERRVLSAAAPDLRITRRPPRQLRSFRTTTSIALSMDRRNARTLLELATADRPGLLSVIGAVFVKSGVRLQAAKITTVGERAEDVFFITDTAHEPLDEVACLKLKDALHTRLDNEAQGNPDR